MPAPARVPESSVSISIRLQCFSKRDGSQWVALCPSLDVVSQGPTENAARASLQEAIELWIESCLERETLESALREVGFRLHARGERIPDGADRVTVRRGPAHDQREQSAAAIPLPRGRTFEIKSEVPAFIAAHLLDSEHAAPAR